MNKKHLFLIIALLCLPLWGLGGQAWADEATWTEVGDDANLRSAIADGAFIKLTADIDLSNSTLSIATGTTVTIDLGGHTLNRGLTARDWDHGGQVITARSGATLNLSNGTLTGGWGGNGGGIANEGGTVNLTNVTITGCVGDDRGGGISNGTGGTLTMNGCTITGNISYDKTAPKGGGGIYNAGTLNMQGKNIINDNWKPNGMRSNLYLKNGTVITVTGDLEGSHVSVDMETLGTFTSGFSTYHDVSPAYFFDVDRRNITSMSLVNGEGQLSSAIPDGGVYYVERSWNETTKRVEATTRKLASDQYTTLTGGSGDVYLNPGWYVVKGSDVVYKNFLYMNGGGDYHLILCDGASLKAEFFIVESPNILHVYGQADDTGKMISTYVHNITIHKCAGIGGTYHNANGPITIHGGDIDVHATYSSAGIGGGGYTSQGGPITIYGGTVRAQGGNEPGGSGGETTGGGAGIGGGRNGDGGVVNIYGGSVYAIGGGSTSGAAGIGSGSYAQNSGTITIYGGYVEAHGYTGAAGIGGGEGTNGADVTIHGGMVKAQCDSYEGPGIGAGENNNDRITYAGTLTVTGGKIYAYGAKRGAGIGGGWNTNGTNVTISGGYVYAEGGQYAAGIGSGCEYSSSDNRHGGTLTVTGGYVEAHGGEDGAGIGGGEDADGGTVNISGGEVRAYGTDNGAGIGGSEDGNGGNVTITGGIVIAESGGDQRAIGAGSDSDSHGSLTFADNLCVFITQNLYRSQKENRVIDCRNFKYVRINQCAHGGHEVTGCKWCYAGEEIHTFGDYGECPVCHLISLADDADNSETISHWATENGSHAVTLSDRTLWKDGDWNTLCLPFSLASLTDTPLEGATVKELDTKGTYDTDKQTGLDDTTLYLYFKNVSAIEAGKPYIVKWDASTTDNIENPVFQNVTVKNGLNDITFPGGTFKGTYAWQEYTQENKSILFLGDNNTLYWPKPSGGTNPSIGACRAYFELSDGVSAREFVLNFGEETTSLPQPLQKEGSLASAEWYTLDGRKFNTKPTKKGVYIYKGKKVIM